MGVDEGRIFVVVVVLVLLLFLLFVVGGGGGGDGGCGVCVCVCVCARARARVSVRACVYVSVFRAVFVWFLCFLTDHTVPSRCPPPLATPTAGVMYISVVTVPKNSRSGVGLGTGKWSTSPPSFKQLTTVIIFYLSPAWLGTYVTNVIEVAYNCYNMLLISSGSSLS